VNQAKSKLRRQLRTVRNSFSNAQRAEHDAAIGRHLSELVKSRRAVSIACYWPFNGEPDITPACRQLMLAGYRLSLPVVTGENGHEMNFHSWRADTGLSKNRYGILEPQNTERVPISSIDMLFMPLVGYDRFGNRLGMGAGYYDRCLETRRDLPAPLRVGIAYSLQEIDRVEGEQWDIRLHGVVNERGWMDFAGQQTFANNAE